MTNTNDQPQPKPEVDMSFLTPMFDEAYNLAIDDACETVKEEWLECYGHIENSLYAQIINQLTQLKKQIP